MRFLIQRLSDSRRCHDSYRQMVASPPQTKAAVVFFWNRPLCRQFIGQKRLFPSIPRCFWIAVALLPPWLGFAPTRRWATAINLTHQCFTCLAAARQVRCRWHR
jgi:hypothetical protein